MTKEAREKAIDDIQRHLDFYPKAGWPSREALQMALEALEQEPILNKIRKEVNKLFISLGDGSEEWRSYVNETVLEVLEIIDKYKAESEGDNGNN